MQNIPTPITAVPPETFVEQVSSLVQKTLNKESWVLSCEEIELTTEEISSKDGLLPLVIWIAGQTLEKIWGPQDLIFRCDSSALCGVVPEFQRPILPSSIWLHAIHSEIEDVATKTLSGPAVIDDWFAQWNNALSSKKIMLLPPLPPTPGQTKSGT